MPTVLKIKGFRFFFFSNEGNEPPHIHVELGDKYAKFWLEPIALARVVGFSGSELTKIRKIVSQHIKLFKEKWNGYFSY